VLQVVLQATRGLVRKCRAPKGEPQADRACVFSMYIRAHGPLAERHTRHAAKGIPFGFLC